ncbi:MAG: hypothetical protein R3E79_15465 [Caldilineaceae bacterium]
MARQSVNKPQLTRTYFSGKSPIQVARDERAVLAQRLGEQLAALNHIKLETHPYHRSEEERNRYLCAFRLDLPNGRPWSLANLRFTLKLDAQGQLLITDGKKEALVSSLAEVVAFARRYQELAEQYHAQASQRQKVRDLKTKAILAQVKKLAKEERFSYYAEPQTRKLDLHIKLAGKKYLTLTIPFAQFQEVVPLIRNAITTLRELSEHQIRFVVSEGSPFYNAYRGVWTTPESLDAEGSS